MTGKITAWLGEPDPVLRQALLKMAEEASELSKACLRAAMVGMLADDPDGGHCYEAINKELSDLGACEQWVRELNGGLIGVEWERAHIKLQGFQRWESMMREAWGKPLTGVLPEPTVSQEGRVPYMHPDSEEAKAEVRKRRRRRSEHDERGWQPK